MADHLLPSSGGIMPETEAEQAAVMQVWGTWYESLGAAVKDPGNPITPAVKMIASDGTVRDGDASWTNGYLILKADSMDAAVEMARRSPVLMCGSSITVFETSEVM